MNRAVRFLALLPISIAASTSSAYAIVIETGSYYLGDFVSGVANVNLGPGKYRFTLSISAPVVSVDPASNAVVKTLNTEFYCTDPANPSDPPFHCGGSDVPQEHGFTPSGPNEWAAFVKVLAPYVTGPVGGQYFHESEICCDINYDFEPLADGTYVIAYSAIPEPAGWAMMMLGFGGVGLMLRRRRTTTIGVAA